MAAEGFFQRWSRRKAGVETDERVIDERPVGIAAPSQAVVAAPQAAAPMAARANAPLPTLHDVALLGPDSDYSAFLAKGVDKTVQRSAMKKLFSDPHFKLMDGLDIHMEDYNKPSPVSAAMLGALQHAQSFFASVEAVKPKPEEEEDATAETPAVHALDDDQDSPGRPSRGAAA